MWIWSRGSWEWWLFGLMHLVVAFLSKGAELHAIDLRLACGV